MTPQERADAAAAGVVISWDDVPERFRSEVRAKAHRVGEERAPVADHEVLTEPILDRLDRLLPAELDAGPRRSLTSSC